MESSKNPEETLFYAKKRQEQLPPRGEHREGLKKL
jgi:hypothetical protein